MLASIEESSIKSIMSGAFGVLLATVGIDLLTTVERFTFGMNELTEGIGFVPVMIEYLELQNFTQAGQLGIVRERITLRAIQLPSKADYQKTWKAILRSSGIGTFIGILPAKERPSHQ